MSYSIKINYEVSGEATPLLPEKYIVGAESNPTIIAEGETVKLNFKADGMYFALKSRKGATATGATLG
jgi:predicted transcriptional regulator